MLIKHSIQIKLLIRILDFKGSNDYEENGIVS